MNPGFAGVQITEKIERTPQSAERNSMELYLWTCYYWQSEDPTHCLLAQMSEVHLGLQALSVSWPLPVEPEAPSPAELWINESYLGHLLLRGSKLTTTRASSGKLSCFIPNEADTNWSIILFPTFPIDKHSQKVTNSLCSEEIQNESHIVLMPRT